MAWSPGAGRDNKGYQSNHPSNKSSIGNSLHGGPTYKAPTPKATGPDYGPHQDTFRGPIPKKKPEKTRDNTVDRGFIKKYFNNNPYFNIAKKISKNKFNTNINAKRREKYLNDLLDTDPDEYNRVMGQLSKINMIVGPEGIETQVGPNIRTDYGMPSAPPGMLTSNFEEIDGRKSLGDDAALEILGQKYKDTLPTFGGDGGGDGNPYILPQYAMMGGGADMGSEDAVEEKTFDYHLGKDGQGIGRDVTLGYLAKGGRARRAEGGIMELRARRAFGGIMDRVTGRRAYGLGSIFKSVKKAVGKVLKSDIGKAAIIGAGIYYGGGGNLFGMQRANAAGFGIPVKGKSFFGQGIAKALRSGVGSMFDPLKPEANLWDKAKKFVPWAALGYGLSKTKLGEAKPNETSFADRGGSLIDPITRLEAVGGGGGMRETLQAAIDEADGDPIKLEAIDAKYNHMLNLVDNRPYPNYVPYATGGRIGKAEGGLMDLGGMEKDYRAEGGFVPIGAKEKADDVPARLSVNEFVFTADAVRGAGQGDIDKGAEIMENMMENLEKGGTVSEESQGNAGAQQMFDTSERLGEVI